MATKKSTPGAAADTPKRVTKTTRKATPKRARTAAATPVEELQTEELWAHYGKARQTANADQLERIRNILMERHYPLVRYIAERLLQTLPKSIELDDLVSAGLFGLMDAIRGFDPGPRHQVQDLLHDAHPRLDFSTNYGARIGFRAWCA